MATKVMLYIAESVDGFIADKDGSVVWLDKYQTTGEDYGYDKFLKRINTVVMGSVTYEQILGFDCDYPYKGKKGFVFTTKKENNSTDDNVTFINVDVEKFIESLDQNKDNNIWLVGGANIIDQFLKNNLIDEFIIHVMPSELKEGIRLFKDSNQKEKLVLKNKK